MRRSPAMQVVRRLRRIKLPHCLRSGKVSPDKARRRHRRLRRCLGRTSLKHPRRLPSRGRVEKPAKVDQVNLARASQELPVKPRGRERPQRRTARGRRQRRTGSQRRMGSQRRTARDKRLRRRLLRRPPRVPPQETGRFRWPTPPHQTPHRSSDPLGQTGCRWVTPTPARQTSHSTARTGTPQTLRAGCRTCLRTPVPMEVNANDVATVIRAGLIAESASR